jgi:hypothetical protein
MCGPIAAKWP